MSKLLFSLILLTNICYAKCRQERVAVVDTGIYVDDPRYSGLLCKGHNWDFVINKPLTSDLVGHGTAITNLIMDNAKNANYCLLEYDYYTYDGWHNLSNEIRSIKLAIKDGATIVNISGGGDSFYKEECDVIRKAKNTLFVLAAGNNGRNIDIKGFYPACCNSKNIIVVGAFDRYGRKTLKSNYGKKVTAWELGEGYVVLPNNNIEYETGTSLSTAIHTGKLVLQRYNNCGRVR